LNFFVSSFDKNIIEEQKDDNLGMLGESKEELGMLVLGGRGKGIVFQPKRPNK
jgi:hypothetical protein